MGGEMMDTKLVGNADSKKWAGETGQHVEGWITSWAGESQEEVYAATPKPIAVSTRGRNQGHSDVGHNSVLDPEETQTRRDFYKNFTEQALARSSEEFNLEGGRITEEDIVEHEQPTAWRKCVDVVQRVPGHQARLFCFPWAGGNSLAFDTWPKRLPGVDVVPILLPGRLTRAGEEALTSVSDMVTMSIEALCGLNLLKYENIPFFIFGHELGALVAFELCRRLNTEFPAGALFVSGMSCPQMVHEREKASALCQTSADGAILHAKNAEFEEAMLQRSQVPHEVCENKDLTGIFTHLWFKDLSAMDSYEYESGGVLLKCPIYSFGGASAHEQSSSGWEMESSSNRCKNIVYPGDDFFLFDPANETRMLQFILDHCRHGEDEEVLHTATLEAIQAEAGATEQDRSSESSG